MDGKDHRLRVLMGRQTIITLYRESGLRYVDIGEMRG